MEELIKATIEEKLRAIYDDDDFVYGTIACLKTTSNAEEMLAFFDAAERAGDPVTHDDAIALSIVISER